jgi:methionyl-tRNA formyltransferase
MRVLFLGTPSSATLPLRRLVDAGHEVVAVVTQPDRPAGRSRTPQPPPVKSAAIDLGLPVLQPETLRDPNVVAQLRDIRPNVGVVAAYGEILRRAVLDIPPLGYLNIHPSLLPLYRGPAPVAAAIRHGDSVTGVSVMLLERAMDAGPILAQATVPLDADARTGPLTDHLFALGSDLLVGVLPLYAGGELVPTPQDHERATFTTMLSREVGRLEWALPAAELERMVRAYDPWPGTWTIFNGQPLKVLVADVVAREHTAPAGTILADDDLVVAAGTDALRIHTVQPAGKRPMAGADWKRGQPRLVGTQLGT